MHDKAYAVLDAIHRGAFAALPDRDSWLKALQTMRWAFPSPDGLVLTAAGRQALEEMRRARRPGPPLHG